MSNVDVNCLAFSPDSRLLASAHRDGTILIWNAALDNQLSTQSTQRKQVILESQQEKWWTDLAGDNSRQAYVAVCGLAAQPQQTVGFLRDRLRPATEVPQEKLPGLIAELDSRQFPEREAARKQLAGFGEQAGPALRAALRNRPSPEQGRSIEQLLDTFYTVRSPEALRQLRAIEILERIGAPEAVEVFAEAGPWGHRSTPDAGSQGISRTPDHASRYKADREMIQPTSLFLRNVTTFRIAFSKGDPWSRPSNLQFEEGPLGRSPPNAPTDKGNE